MARRINIEKGSLDAPKSGGGNSGMSALMGYILAQKKGQAGQAQMGPGSIATRQTDPSTGVTTENPEAAAQVKSAETMGQRVAETSSPRAIMKGVLVNAKKLTDTVQPPPPGIGKFIKGAQTAIKGETGEIPQIKEFNRMIDSSLAAFSRTMYSEKGTQSDRDISRMRKAFSDITWDTEDQRALGWNRAIETYNDVIGSYKGLQNEILDKRELLSPKEIGRSRLLSGMNEYSDLNDEELEGVFEGPLNIEGIKPFLETAISEYEKRGLDKKGNI